MSEQDGRLIGEKSEMMVAVDLIDNGCRVSYTHGHAHPYDLIADKDGDLLKIQVKTAKHRHKRRYFISSDERYDEDNVDLFAGYVHEEDEVFYAPIQELDPRIAVTFTPPEEMGSEANRKRANLPADYTFEQACDRWEKYDNEKT